MVRWEYCLWVRHLHIFVLILLVGFLPSWFLVTGSVIFQSRDPQSCGAYFPVCPYVVLFGFFLRFSAQLSFFTYIFLELRACILNYLYLLPSSLLGSSDMEFCSCFFLSRPTSRNPFRLLVLGCRTLVKSG